MARLGRFAATRVVTGLLGLLWIFALARWMPVAAYAGYAVLMAAVAVAGLVGAFGTDRVLYRELPLACHARARAQVLRLLGFALAPRLVVAPAGTVVLIAWAAARQTQFNDPWVWWFGVGLALSAAFSSVLGVGANAMLRFEVQARIAAAMLAVRLAAAAALYFAHGDILLLQALAIVLVANLLEAALSWLLAIRRALPPLRVPPAVEHKGQPLAVLARAALANYLSYLFALPWQGAAAIMLVGRFGAPHEVALFSLFQNLIERMRLYLPLQLLQNAFEPLLMHRYARDRDRAHVLRVLDVLRRINLFILGLAAVIAAACGDPLLAWATGGRYSEGWLLLVVLVVALGMRGIGSVLYIAANVFNQMGALARAQGLVSIVGVVPLVLAAWWFADYGVAVTQAFAGIALWVVMYAWGKTSARGLWRPRADIWAALGLAAGAAAGHWTRQHALQGPLVSTALALLVGVAIYLATSLWLKPLIRRSEIRDLQLSLREAAP